MSNFVNCFAETNIVTCQIIFFYEKIFCELSLINQKIIQMGFPLNDLKFLMYHYNLEY